MKIFLIYTPRSGSTSILRYFSQVKPEYQCFNEPWFEWMITHHHHSVLNYDEVIKKDNIFIKSAYKTLPVPIENIMNDFNKVIFLLRRNMEEQIESSILTHKNESFLNYDKKKYWIGDIVEEEIIEARERFEFLNSTLRQIASEYNKPLFYYEDLYYNDFTSLFKELEIEYNERYFKEILDNSKRYRIGTIEDKKIKTII